MYRAMIGSWERETSRRKSASHARSKYKRKFFYFKHNYCWSYLYLIYKEVLIVVFCLLLRLIILVLIINYIWLKQGLSVKGAYRKCKWVCSQLLHNGWYVNLLLFALKITYLKVLKTTYFESIFFSFPSEKYKYDVKKRISCARLYLIQQIIFLFYQLRNYK